MPIWYPPMYPGVIFLGMFALITDNLWISLSSWGLGDLPPKVVDPLADWFTHRVIVPICIFLVAFSFHSFRAWPGLAWPGLTWPDLGNEDIDSDTSANILSRFSLAMNVTLSPSDGFRSNDHWIRYTHYKKCNPHEGLMENKRGSFMNQASWRPWCSGSVCGFVFG